MHPLPHVDLEEIQCRTVVAENLPADHSIEPMEQLFGSVGNVKMVHICEPELHAPVEFGTVEQAEQAVFELTDQRNWRSGLCVPLLLRRTNKHSTSESHKINERADGSTAEDDATFSSSDRLDEPPVKILHTQRQSFMGRLLIFVLLLARCFFLSKAEMHMSNTVKYKEDYLVFSLYKSSESVSLCNESSSSIKSSSSLFASHQMPNGAVLDLCLEPSGRLYCEFSTSLESNSSFGLEVMDLERKLLGSGAHRELRSSVTIKLENVETCNMVIVERLSSGVFADMFELQGLVAREVYAKAVLYGDHNLELPALHSLQSMVVIHKSFKSKSKDLLQAEVSIPLHARYPPLSLESHVAVGFKFPILLFQCFRKGDDASNANVNASNDNMAWALLTKKESSLIDIVELQWLVPAGNPLHSKIVAAITACTSFIGIVTLWVVSKRSYQLQKNKVA